MNNKIYIVDRNGNQIIAEGISLFNLKGDGYSNDYLFYTLNEVVNGGLNKIYVAKVSDGDKNISEDEWKNVKVIMLAITHQETVDGLSYGNIFDEKGEGKTFNVDIPRKIALKLDKLTALNDAYKLATTNPDNKSNTAAVGASSNVPNVEIVGNSAQVVQETVEEVTPTPVETPAPVEAQAPVAPVEVQPVTVETVPATPTPVEAAEPTIPVPPVLDLQAPVTEVVDETQPVEAPPVETAPAPEPTIPVGQTEVESDPIKSIVPTPIPEVLNEEKNTDDFAIPVRQVQPVQTDNDDEVFNEIIKELKDIRTQNEEIKESIRKLTNNIANINTNLSGQEIKQAQGNYDGMINTNMANTTEDVSAIDITSNGTVVIPSFEEAQRSATQSANVISTNIIEPSPVIEQPVSTPAPVIEQPTSIVQPVSAPAQTVLEEPVAAPAPIQQVIEQPVNIAPPVISAPEPAPVDAIPAVQPVQTVQPVQVVQPVNDAPAIPVAPEPVASPVPAPVTETTVAEVPELPQILPDVPMASDVPNMKIPEFDPNAGLPPVQMPTGVSAGEDSSAVGSTISGLPQ